MGAGLRALGAGLRDKGIKEMGLGVKGRVRRAGPRERGTCGRGMDFGTKGNWVWGRGLEGRGWE